MGGGGDHPANFCSDIKISIHVVKLQRKGCNGSAGKCSVFPNVDEQRGWTEEKKRVNRHFLRLQTEPRF